jgi:uncharacterized protein (DUF2236 family)
LTLLAPVQRALVGEVRALFNDKAKGEQPVQRSDTGLLSPDSVAWRVHGDVTTMMVGGIAALLLQMLHPVAVAGVWDHSNFRRDMLGRLRRTARFMAATTYADRDEALAAIDRVRTIHAHVGGTLKDGTPYRADDPHVLAWVHVAGSLCFLDAWIRFGEPGMTRADQDRYFADVAYTARALGADPVPETRVDAEALLASFRPELAADERSGEIARLVLDPTRTKLRGAPVQSLMMQAAIDLLPPWARAMHGLKASVLARPAVDLLTGGLASTLRWAFAAEGRR